VKTGISPRAIESKWLISELFAGVALDEIEAAEGRIGMDAAQIKAMQEHSRKRQQLHENMLYELSLTRSEKREQAEAAQRLSDSMNRPQRRDNPIQRQSAPAGQQAHAAPPATPGAPSGHFTKDGKPTLPPLPTKPSDTQQ